MRCIKAATKHQGVSFPDRRDGGGKKHQPADAAQASQAQKNKQCKNAMNINVHIWDFPRKISLFHFVMTSFLHQ